MIRDILTLLTPFLPRQGAMIRGNSGKDKQEKACGRRTPTFMSQEDIASGRKSHWQELEITGTCRAGGGGRVRLGDARATGSLAGNVGIFILGPGSRE